VRAVDLFFWIWRDRQATGMLRRVAKLFCSSACDQEGSFAEAIEPTRYG
jgi:hypothetical protein